MILRRPAPFLLSLLAFPLALLSGCTSLKGISITPGSAQLTAAGQTIQFTAIGSEQMGSATPSSSNVTNQVTWSVSNPNVATINQSGLAVAVGNGTTEVMAESNGITATSTITVSLPSSGSGSGSGSPSLSVGPSSVTETFDGETTQFIAMGSLNGATPQNVSSQVTWVSSNTQVATVNASGLATAIGAGTSTITAYYAGISNTATVTVTISSTTPSVPQITIIPTEVNAAGAGAQSQLIAIGNLTGNGAVQNLTNNVTWSSSSFQDVSVTQTGLATALITPAQGTTASSVITAIGVDSTGSVVTATMTFSITAPGTAAPASETLTLYEIGSGSGNISSSSGGLNCGNGGSVCAGTLTQNTVVTLTATPASGHTFAGWTGPCVTSTPTSCNVTMTSNETIGATFN
jgi:uncharacterized repeat protein (TIGR02543 family)